MILFYTFLILSVSKFEKKLTCLSHKDQR